MALTIENIRQLWKDRNWIFQDSKNRAFVARFDKVLKLATQLVTSHQYCPSKPPFLSTPEKKRIVANKWARARAKMLNCLSRTYYPEDGFLMVVELLNLEQREPQFRIASNAGSLKNYETASSTISRQNPESRIACYNWPWELVRFMKDPELGNLRTEGDALLDKKFYLKYLWMLGTQGKDLIKIVSYRSYLNLCQSGLLGEVIHKSISFERFKSEFQERSKYILDEVFKGIPSKEKSGNLRDLSKLLFIESVG